MTGTTTGDSRLYHAEGADDAGLSRRRFLQYTAMGAAGAAAVPLLGPAGARAQSFAAAATPPDAGILVIIYLGGGNDSVNMVAPVGQGRYHDLRPRLALDNDEVHHIGSGLGFHYSMPLLKQRYDAGQVAVVQGVGKLGEPDLSHFSSTQRWQRGSERSVDEGTGWIGRWLDGLSGVDDLAAVGLGDYSPPEFVGRNVQGVGMPVSGRFGFYNGHRGEDRAIQRSLGRLAAGTTGLGGWADAIADSHQEAVELAGDLAPAYEGSLPNGLAKELAICARLINANVGVRVLRVTQGSYDTHADQSWRHSDLLSDLDTAIEAFFWYLDPRYAGQVTLMTVSEFGRRPGENGSRGTDHGTAASTLVVGSKVRGGLYGQYPSLSALDSRNNLVPSVDFRSLYATVLESWLDGDRHEILGGNFENLGLFASTPGNRTVVRPPPRPGARHGYLLVTTRGDVHNFGNKASYGGSASPSVVGAVGHPSGRGYWLATPDGGVESFGEASHHGSMLGRGMAAPIVDMASTITGAGYWLLGSDGGVFSFGDARFFGSTGGMQLNRPVVGMAAHPHGKGYWFVASDGGIFAYGRGVGFFGSTGAIRLNRPVVGMASTPSGQGYWLVASDGGIFAFGDARFLGSTGSLSLAAPIIGMASTPSGQGYWLFSADGGIFAFGDADFEGSLGGSGAWVSAAAV